MTAPASTAAPAPARRKRGTENVRDMLLSLLAVFAVILPFYWLAGAADEEEGGVQVVDPSADLAALQQALPGVPVPQGLPAGWRPTSSTLRGADLRIGYVTPDAQYAEYRAVRDAGLLPEQTGEGERTADLQVGARSFQVWSSPEGATSLVLQQPGWTVVVGGVRESAEDDELTELAGSLR